MKLLRKINNNAAVAQDNRGREMVVLRGRLPPDAL